MEEGGLSAVRRGFGFSVRTAKAGPGNTAVRELLGSEAYAEAGLSFLRETGQGRGSGRRTVRAYVKGSFSRSMVSLRDMAFYTV